MANFTKCDSVNGLWLSPLTELVWRTKEGLKMKETSKDHDQLHGLWSSLWSALLVVVKLFAKKVEELNDKWKSSKEHEPLHIVVLCTVCHACHDVDSRVHYWWPKTLRVPRKDHVRLHGSWSVWRFVSQFMMQVPVIRIEEQLLRLSNGRSWMDRTMIVTVKGPNYSVLI